MNDKEICVTPEMIEIGISRLREFKFGDPEEMIVEAIYLTMHTERLAKVPAPSWSVKAWWKHNPWPTTSVYANEDTARLVAAHWAKRSGTTKVEIIAS